MIFKQIYIISKMAETEGSKDVRNLDKWDDDLSKLIAPKKKDSSTQNEATNKQSSEKAALNPNTSNSSAPSQSERVPTSNEFESEWAEKIKQAKKSDASLLSERQTSARKPDNIEDVLTQLKKNEQATSRQSSILSNAKNQRLEKIGGGVKGQIGRVKERELTGVGVPGAYKLYPMGGIPPLNLLSKALASLSGKSLEKDLEKSNIPLYKDEYVSFSVGMSFIISIMLFLLVFSLNLSDIGNAIALGLMFFIIALFLISLLLINLPSLKVGSGSRNVDTQLPFALRHMSALLSAGISIFDSITSVSKAEYGQLSVELDKVVWDVKSGDNLSDALEAASERINSASFTRVTIHIRRALQMGGDVAGIISQIADDLTFEMRMKVADFVEKLNAFAIVYLIGGIVGPVVIAVFTVVGSAGPLKTMGGAMMDPSMLMFMVLLVFPMMMMVITYVVKLMEPKV